MWGASRWTARFLLLVMLAPAFGPLALARAAQPEAMQCMRQSVSERSEQPAMQCHHAMAQSKPPRPEPSEAAFQAADNCCENHDCCRGVTTSEWARPASSLFPCSNLLIEPARPSRSAVLQSSDISGDDSARAPPRS
jgi:hypothetical protein